MPGAQKGPRTFVRGPGAGGCGSFRRGVAGLDGGIGILILIGVLILIGLTGVELVQQVAGGGHLGVGLQGKFQVVASLVMRPMISPFLRCDNL